MYPNLFYLVKDLFGIELSFLQVFQSFGVMVAVSFLLAAYFFSSDLKRKESEGKISTSEKKILKGEAPKSSELIISGITGFVIFFKLVYIALNFEAFTYDTQGTLLSTIGNFWGGLAGGGLMAWMRYREIKKEQLPEPKWITETLHPYQHVPNMTLIAAVAGILGAKIFHNLENLDEFMQDPLGNLLSFSGLTMYGGLIVAAFSVIYYARKNGIPTLHLIDACAPALMLAYGVGRIGCHIAGDGDWGIVNLAEKPSWFFLPDWAWGFTYPNNVNNDGVYMADCAGKYCSELPHPVFPTPFYEAVVCIGLFGLLWSIRKKINAPGVMFSLYLLLNGLERFFIEKIRINNKFDLLGMQATQAEVIATIFILLGMTGIIYFRKQFHARSQGA